MTIGGNLFEAKIVRKEDYPHSEYELTKNGVVIIKVGLALRTTYDPNVGFWNIEGKLVWEVAARPPS